MSEPTHPEVAILSAVLELPKAERAAYLDQACAGDAALRQQVEALLQAHDQAEGFLDAPPAGLDFNRTVRVNIPLTEKPGDRIGRYKLLQQIGEGGCGVVYMAEQEEPVRRRVALKVIKLGMDTKQVIARFEAERQALALMDHPNIAKIFDAGVTEASVVGQASRLSTGRLARESATRGETPPKAGGTPAPLLSPGRPYFVMELVRGIKITDFCDENKLSTQDRLKLFIQVCQAIQHAHQKGVIHRDIKPSNILVTINDGVPVPKVIDFGIARATAGRLTDQTLFTAFEQFIGTPAYMSPEQAVMTSLDIDTRSDIYSLGVLLYELLTGKTPFDQKELLAAGLDEMRRTIREEEPPRPSTRLSTLAAEALTAIANHHHTDAPRLLHELRGDLDWIVMKCLEKNRQQRYETANGVAMDVQRHLSCEPVVARPHSRLYVFQKTVRRHRFGFAAAGAVIVVLVLGVLGSTWQALRATRAEREQARLREIAESKEKKSEQVARFLEAMLDGVGPSVALGRDTRMLQEILDKTAERVGKDLTNQPQVEMELRGTIGRAYQALADYQKAEGMLNEAVRLCRKLPGNNEPQLARLLADLGMVLWREGKFDDAKASASEAVALCRKMTGEESRRELALALNSLATVQWQFRRRDAEATLQEALEIQKTLLDKNDPALLATMGNLASVLAAGRKSTEAEKILREVVAVEEPLQGEGFNLAIHLNSLGLILRDKGDLAEAETTLRRALELRRKLYPKEHADLAQSLASLARVLTTKGDLEGAEEYFQEALVMRRKIFPNGSQELAQNLSDLGNLLQKKSKLAGAEVAHREALAMRRTLFGDDNQFAASSFENLGSMLEAAGKLDEARTLYTEMVNGKSAIAAAAQFRLADLYRTGRGVPRDPLEAVKWFRQSADHGNRAAEFMLGQAYSQGMGVSKDLEEAVAWYRKAAEHGHQYAQNALGTAYAHGLGVAKDEAEAVKWYQKSADQGNPHAAGNLARMYAGGMGVPKDVSQATKWYRLAAAGGTPEILNGIAWLMATSAEARLRDGSSAVGYAERAVAATSRTNAGYLDTLAVAYAEAGQFADAVRVQREAIALVPTNQADLRVELESRLPLFESGIPYRDHGELAAMAGVLLTEGKFTEAERPASQCLALREKQIPNDWRTFNAMAVLGGCLLGQKKFADAGPLLISGYEGMKLREAKIPTAAKIRLKEALERLVQLYEATNQPDQAAEWKRKLAEFNKAEK